VGGQGDQVTEVRGQRSGVKKREEKKFMSKIVIRLALGAVLFTLSVPTEAQQLTKVFRIAYLSNVPFSDIPYRIEAFRRGLRDLGYVEGKNILIEWRSGTNDQIPALVAELARLKVDVIVTAAVTSTRFAKEATSTIPIVMAQDSDPVANGFVASLARPGGNITGLSTHAPEISGKKLEILKEVVPRLARAAVFVTSTTRESSVSLKEIELAAKALKVKIQYLDVLGPKDLETAFREARKGRADGVLMEVSGPVYIPNRKKTPELAVKSRLPVMYRRAQDVEAGGLMTYGVNLTDLDRRAATYVDKILKGRTPADLPVEQPMKFEFIVNLQAAKAIGLTFPQWTLMKADKVIQ
jgi:putative ABC transport system substrate-binding protein